LFVVSSPLFLFFFEKVNHSFVAASVSTFNTIPLRTKGQNHYLKMRAAGKVSFLAKRDKKRKKTERQNPQEQSGVWWHAHQDISSSFYMESGQRTCPGAIQLQFSTRPFQSSEIS
jgi:hypothetical protein